MTNQKLSSKEESEEVRDGAVPTIEEETIRAESSLLDIFHAFMKLPIEL